MAEILKGKPIADKLKKGLKKEIETFRSKLKLVAVQVGEDDASKFYINNQRKQTEMLGIEYDLQKFSKDISQTDIENIIEGLNDDPSVTAIIIQSPLPKSLNFRPIMRKVHPYKDAEGMTPQNLGKLLVKTGNVGPCTPMAVMQMLKFANIELYGKDVVIIGHSKLLVNL